MNFVYCKWAIVVLLVNVWSGLVGQLTDLLWPMLAYLRIRSTHLKYCFDCPSSFLPGKHFPPHKNREEDVIDCRSHRSREKIKLLRERRKKAISPNSPFSEMGVPLKSVLSLPPIKRGKKNFCKLFPPLKIISLSTMESSHYFWSIFQSHQEVLFEGIYARDIFRRILINYSVWAHPLFKLIKRTGWLK